MTDEGYIELSLVFDLAELTDLWNKIEPLSMRRGDTLTIGTSNIPTVTVNSKEEAYEWTSNQYQIIEARLYGEV